MILTRSLRAFALIGLVALAACAPAPTPTATPRAAATEAPAEATEAAAEATAEMEATEEMADMEATAEMEATEEMADKTIVDIASENDDFSTLVAAVVAAELAETLSGGEFTVFAPTNEAFDAALESLGLELADLVADKELLTSILTYHVIEGTVLAEAVLTLDGEEVETVNGETIRITIEDDVVVLNDKVRVTATDIVASNGVIHVIDGVLLPPSMAPEATAEPEATATATPRPARATATPTPRP